MESMWAHRRAAAAVLSGIFALCPCAAGEDKTPAVGKPPSEQLTRLLGKYSQDNELVLRLWRSDDKPHTVASAVDAERFFEQYVGVVSH